MKRLSIVDEYLTVDGTLAPTATVNHTLSSWEDVTGTNNSPLPSPNSLTIEVVVTDVVAVAIANDLYVNWIDHAE